VVAGDDETVWTVWTWLARLGGRERERELVYAIEREEERKPGLNSAVA
jgi:hypothetical protein